MNKPIEPKQLAVVFTGHIDHGKSSILGRLLLEIGQISREKLERQKELAKERKLTFSYAHLLDSLVDEQKLGITIDVARTTITTQTASIRIFDAPGHREFLQNMVTGASRAKSALLVIDVEQGIEQGTKLHLAVLELLGIKQIAVAINKMDIVNYSQDSFVDCISKITPLLESHNISPQHFIPVSAQGGDNLCRLSDKTPWYNKKSLLETLEDMDTETNSNPLAPRIFIQDNYLRNNQNIVSGLLTQGKLSVNDQLKSYPSNKIVEIDKFCEWQSNDPDTIFGPKSISFLTKTGETVPRGEFLCLATSTQPKHSNTIWTNLLWLAKSPLQTEKNYILRIGTAKYTVICSEIQELSLGSNQMSEANELPMGNFARVLFKSQEEIYYFSDEQACVSGRFVVVQNSAVCGGGTFCSS